MSEQKHEDKKHDEQSDDVDEEESSVVDSTVASASVKTSTDGLTTDGDTTHIENYFVSDDKDAKKKTTLVFRASLPTKAESGVDTNDKVTVTGTADAELAVTKTFEATDVAGSSSSSSAASLTTDGKTVSNPLGFIGQAVDALNKAGFKDFQAAQKKASDAAFASLKAKRKVESCKIIMLLSAKQIAPAASEATATRAAATAAVAAIDTIATKAAISKAKMEEAQLALDAAIKAFKSAKDAANEDACSLASAKSNARLANSTAEAKQENFSNAKRTATEKANSFSDAETAAKQATDAVTETTAAADAEEKSYKAKLASAKTH